MDKKPSYTFKFSAEKILQLKQLVENNPLPKKESVKDKPA